MVDAADVEMVHALRLAQANPALLSQLQELYERVEAQRPADLKCGACGKCCNFPAYGHRLYASTAEVALLLRQPLANREQVSFLCPYQAGSACDARVYRPLGCRIFFCCANGNFDYLQQCEAFHNSLRLLHQMHCTPYIYADLTHWIKQSPK